MTLSAAEEQNFCFPVRLLEDEKIVLVPFKIDLHGEAYWLAMSQNPRLMYYVPWGPFPTFESFRKWYEEHIQSDNCSVLFAIELKSPFGWKARRPVLAVLTNFQRNSIAAQACVLLLNYALDPPPLGLGLKEIHARSQASNSPVANLVSKVDGNQDATFRWDGEVPAEKLASMPDGSYVQDRYDENGNHIGHTVYGRRFVISAEVWEAHQRKKKETAKL